MIFEMTNNRRYDESATSQYYNSSSDFYDIIWNGQIHTGLFSCEKTLSKACADMTRFLAHIADLPNFHYNACTRKYDRYEGKRILSVGCGTGASDRILASEFGANVTGIDISRNQLEKAVKRAESSGLNISYHKYSMTNLPFNDNSFDAVWAQQSFFHCHKKRIAIAEFYRILKPKGLVILEDSVKTELDRKNEVVKWFGERLKVNEIWSLNEYFFCFKNAGFQSEPFVLYPAVLSIDLSVYLLKTYEKIIQITHSRRKFFESANFNAFGSIDDCFGLCKSRDLVSQGKLGCVAMIFEKKQLTPAPSQ